MRRKVPPAAARLALLAVAAALVAVMPPRRASAQVGSSTDIIAGRVTGPGDAPLEGATVEVTSLETEITRTKSTNGNGQFTILFPDGGGQYRVTIRYLGMAQQTVMIAREADEDRFVLDIHMSPVATTLTPVVVEGIRTPPRGERPGPGSVERVLTGEQLQRLPVDPSDPNAIALLAPGVVGVAGSDSTAAGFSVAGQRPDQNQVTLDGLTFEAGGVPTEAIRNTRVITSTYDITRGQFTGGQIATTTRGGTNFTFGSATYGLRDPHLQWTPEDEPEGSLGRASAASTSAYTQHQLSAGLGGPIRRNTAFWFGSFQLRRRLNPLESLLDVGTPTLVALGVDPDSADRFLAVVEGLGVPVNIAGIPDDRLNDNATAIARFDFHPAADHSVMLRLNWQGSLQKGFRVGTLDVPHYGGEQSSDAAGAMVTVSSVVNAFINELRAYYSSNARDGDPYLDSPAGRLHLSGGEGTVGRGFATLDFGGNPGLPSGNGGRLIEVSDELSWLSGSASHRWKLGALINTNEFDRTAGGNRSGTFTFNSLAALEANQPSSFTRTLSGGDRSGRTTTGAVYLGDTWRRGRALQVTYGLRAEGSWYHGKPAYNPEVDQLFGRRTDRFPSDIAVSPRIGFTWMPRPTSREPAETERQSGAARGGGGGGRGRGRVRGGAGGLAAGGAGSPLIVRGGVGEFRGRAPTQLFSAALDATGLASSEVQITCIGAAVPVPDWSSYLADPSTIPSACVGAGGGTPGGSSLPNVTVFDPAYSAPRSWRGSLGATRRLGDRLSVSLDVGAALGVSQYGVRDLNLDATPDFVLADESGRPVFVPPGTIVPATGAVSSAASRIEPAYAHVYEVHSDLASRTGQVTVAIGGAARRSMLWNGSYTYSRSRDRSSFTSGFGGGSAAGAFGDPTSAGNPNDPVWAPSDFERRHIFTGSATWLVKPWLDLTSFVRFTSGGPYTPRVAGDINGDGARNDRAYVFSPSGAPDTALANGMARLLDIAPERAADCLRSQLGAIAARNSCRNDWSATLDLQANIRPWLGAALQRRLQIFVSIINPLGGLDQLLHGSRGMRGWGQPSYADPTLLQVRGFDPAEQRFLYTVNERFGQDLAARAARRNPFQLALQMRLQIGRDPQRERLEAVLRRGAAAGGPGGGFDLETVVSRVAPNPTAAIVELRDSLALTDAQVVALEAIADSLKVRNDSLVDSLRTALAKELSSGAALATIFPMVQPRLQAARQAYLAAVRSAREVLTPEQWEKLPESVRNPTLRPGRDGDQRPRRRPPGA